MKRPLLVLAAYELASGTLTLKTTLATLASCHKYGAPIITALYPTFWPFACLALFWDLTQWIPILTLDGIPKFFFSLFFFVLLDFSDKFVHDAHAILAFGMVCFGDASILYVSGAYFILDFVHCIKVRDRMFALHALLALILIGLSLRAGLGYRILAIEFSTLFLHHWQRTKLKRDYIVFLLSFFFARIVFLPYETYQISFVVRDARLLVLLALNLLQFAWFAKLLTMLPAYDPLKATQLAT